MVRIVALASAALALAADLLPLAPGPGPLFSLCLVFAWGIRAPDALGAPVVFLIGVVLDGLAGAPLGLTSLPLLLVHTAASAIPRFLVGASLASVWAAFALAALFGCGLRWLLAAAWWWQIFDLRPVLVEAMLTLAAYPLVGWPISRLPVRPRSRQHAAGA